MIPASIVLAAGAGGVARYWLSGVVQRWRGGSFPAGTLVVNLLGAFLFGLLVGGVAERGSVDSAATAVVLGFFSGFTTFSTWAVESVGLAAEGSGAGVRRGVVNIVVPLIGGVGLASLGLWLSG